MRTQPMYENLVDRIETNPDLDAIADGVDRASEALGDGATYRALRGDWTGHALHPVLTDLPIGCWVSAGLLDLVGGRSGRRAAQRLIGLGLLATPVTTLSGLADYRTMPDRPTMRVGAVHAVGNTVAAIMYFMSWRRRRAGRHVSGVALGLVGGSLVAVTGYLGGHMSFARSTGTGPRGSMPEAPADDEGWSASDAELGELIPVDEAAELLTVPVDQVLAMVEEGMLTSVTTAGAGAARDGDGTGELRASDVRVPMAEVLAVRHLGG